MLARGDDLALPIVILLAIGLGLAWAVALWVRERVAPRQVGRVLGRFFRQPLDRLETHDKTFPGYDLGSLHRALADFQSECCADATQVGACNHSLRDVVSATPEAYAYKEKPTKPSYERMPVDVEREESFVSNCLYLLTLRPEVMGGGARATPGEKLAVQLKFAKAHVAYDDELDTQATPRSTLSVSVACRSRDVADMFFNDIDARRRRVSIYRGKVVDPVMHRGGIQSLGFRRIKPVGEGDLILPESVKSLVQRSVVGFYRHRDTLRGLGVEMKRGVLFHGPPGTGKTSISLYLAGHLPNFTVCFVSGERLMYPRELCRMARYLQPSMLVFEDIDLIAQERDVNGLATVLGELMNQIDGCEPDEQVLFVMNTNSLDRLEQAVRNRPGRVDQIVNIPLPDVPARRQLLRHFATNLRLADEVVERAVAATEGATPALLKEVVKRAAVNAVERVAQDNGSPGSAVAAGESPAAGTSLEVTEGDLMLAVQQVQMMRDGHGVVGARVSDAIL